MKKNILIGIAMVVTLVLVTSSAFAWGPGYSRGTGYGGGSVYGHGYGIPPVSNLTPEQSSKIQALQRAQLNDMAPLQQQLLAKKLELRSLWLAQNPDQAKISALQKDMLNIRGQLQEKATNARFEMRKVLTPEQQAQLTAYGPGMGHGMGRMAGHMGRW
jgi:zinc resistance-associated protein